MVKTSRKNLRPKTTKPARTRNDHSAGCRVSDAELAAVNADIALIKQASGIAPSLGAYCKHALLSHPRYRRLEVGLRKLLADENVQSYFAGELPAGDSLSGKEFHDSVRALLEEAAQ